MSDIAPIESAEFAVPNSLRSIEGKSYSNLPGEVRIEDKGLMTTLRLLSERTKITGTEWSGYITKDKFGTLSTEYIRPGEEAESQSVEIEDTSVLFDMPEYYQTDYDLVLRMIEQERFRAEGGSAKKIFVGRNLPQLPREALHDGVVIIPNREFFALVHTHPNGSPFSPGDLAMMIWQRHVGDRPLMPMSIVVGPENFYVLAVPSDGQIEKVSGYGAEKAKFLAGSMKLDEEFNRFSEGQDRFQAIGPYIKRIAKERKLGFYQGNLKDEVLRRVVK